MGKIIENVTIMKSQIDIGGEIKPCLAALVYPWPETDAKLEQVADALRACLLGLKSDV